MMSYEVLMLVRPDITSDEFSTLEKQFDHIISATNGKIQSFDRWGKYRLAYPVRKNNYGVYVLVRFELMPSDIAHAMRELQLFFRIKFSDIVMRYVSKRLPSGVEHTYKKPESIDMGTESRLDPSLKNFAETLLNEADNGSFEGLTEN